MTNLQIRTWRMLLGWGTAALGYHIGRYANKSALIIPETFLDKLIDFSPQGIWIYASFFILIPITFFSCKPDRLLKLQRAFQWSGLFGAIIFIGFPSTLIYPLIPDDGISSSLLTYLVSFDEEQNCLPSLHGALTLLCIWALWDSKQHARNIVYLVWGLLITFSTIQLRRHLSIDFGAGLLLGIMCGILSGFQFKR